MVISTLKNASKFVYRLLSILSAGKSQSNGDVNSKIESELWKKSMMVRSRWPITIPKAETCSNNLNQGREENIEGSVRILWSLTGPNQ